MAMLREKANPKVPPKETLGFYAWQTMGHAFIDNRVILGSF